MPLRMYDGECTGRFAEMMLALLLLHDLGRFTEIMVVRIGLLSFSKLQSSYLPFLSQSELLEAEPSIEMRLVKFVSFVSAGARTLSSSFNLSRSELASFLLWTKMFSVSLFELPLRATR